MGDLVSRFGTAGEVGAPYQPSSETSREAAVSVAKNVQQQRADVYLCILRAGNAGRTWDEIVVILGCSPTTNGRVSELRDLGLIVDSGLRRKTRTGRNAVVWIVAPQKQKEGA